MDLRWHTGQFYPGGRSYRDVTMMPGVYESPYLDGAEPKEILYKPNFGAARGAGRARLYYVLLHVMSFYV